jgi:hypothetical protein
VNGTTWRGTTRRGLAGAARAGGSGGDWHAASRRVRLLPLPWALAMAVLASRVDTWPAAFDVTRCVTLVVALGVALVAGGPEQVWRPVARSVLWSRLAYRYRNTIMCAMFVIAVALARPPAWGAALDALVFCGYLVSLDLVTAGAPIRARVGRVAFVVSVMALAVGTAALAAVPRFDASWPRVVAAVTTGVVVLCVLLPMRLVTPGAGRSSSPGGDVEASPKGPKGSNGARVSKGSTPGR